MNKFYLDYKDNRLKYIKELLTQNGDLVFDFESNLSNIKSEDICIVSPAYKWKSEVVSKLPRNVRVFGGNYDENLKESFSKINYYNMMENEDFVLKNASYTAEGFLADLISNTKYSIFERKILVLGSGRVAKAVEYLLYKLGVKFDTAMRSQKEYQHAKLLACQSFMLDEVKKNLSNYDCIINTIPSVIFDKDDVERLSKDCVVFELASKKCIDESCINKINFVNCPALPSKYMCNSAGKLIYELIKEKENI